MTTDFRALCAELVELCSSPVEGVTGLIERWEQVWDLATRARAGLAQSEPEGPTPADGEVAELVAWLRREAELNNYTAPTESRNHRRAADLLERLSPPQPVPVSERLPGPEECIDEGWAWFFNPRTGWRQATQPVHSTYTHWLPAHALPVPTSENV